MQFSEALVWLCQNPESVLLRGTRLPLTLNQNGSLMQLGKGRPQYAIITVRDIVAADWQGMAIDAFVQQVEQAKQAG